MRVLAFLIADGIRPQASLARTGVQVACPMTTASASWMAASAAGRQRPWIQEDAPDSTRRSGGANIDMRFAAYERAILELSAQA